MCESHAFGRKPVDVGRVGLAAVAADVAESAVVGNYEHKVGLGRVEGVPASIRGRDARDTSATGARQQPGRGHLQELTSSHWVAPFIKSGR
jgi:hypothetical protein